MKIKNKKKKGFTLIELVIVLAVLAIIALIAIPNFTKVRNDSLEKSDLRSAEQIEKITLMAVADEKVKGGDIYTLSFGTDKKFLEVKGSKLGQGTVGDLDTDYEMLLKDVKKPQFDSNDKFYVKIGDKGDVQVRYKDATGKILAGPATLAS